MMQSPPSLVLPDDTSVELGHNSTRFTLSMFEELGSSVEDLRRKLDSFGVELHNAKSAVELSAKESTVQSHARSVSSYIKCGLIIGAMGMYGAGCCVPTCVDRCSIWFQYCNCDAPT